MDGSQPSKGRMRAMRVVLWGGIVLALLGMALLAIFLLWRDGGGELPSPEQAYESLDSDAQRYPDRDDVPVVSYPAGGSGATFLCESQLTVDLASRRVALLFANPTRSHQNAVIALVIGDTVVAQSGRIEAGYQITGMSLGKAAELSQGIYGGMIHVYFFDAATGQRTLNAECPVTVTVK